MAQHPDVVIVGGGVIGLTAAYFLAEEGLQVCVVERGQPGKEASWAGAGIIPPGNPNAAKTPLDQLRAVGSNYFPSFSKSLQSLTGIDNGYRVCGGIEYLGEDVEETVAAWKAEGIGFELIQPRSPYGNADGYLIPGMAQLRNPWHLAALESACRLKDVEIRAECAVKALEANGERLRRVFFENGESLDAVWFIVAAGAWSDSLLAPFGVSTGITPVRGQIALLKFEAPPVRRILLAGKRYIVPREDGHVLIGSTEEPEAGFVKENTPEAIDELLDFAVELAPPLAGGTLVKTWAGLRPGSADGLPSIGRVAAFDNLLLASGHFRAGIQMSPATAMVLRDLVTGEKPRIPLEDFRPGRPPGQFVRPAFRS